MIMLSNEDYEYVKQYEDTYRKASTQNYAHILPRSVNERLNEIIGGEGKKNWGCTVCCMTLYRKLHTILQEEEARRQKNREKMEKVREAKKNKENNTQEENGRKTTEPEQLNQ